MFTETQVPTSSDWTCMLQLEAQALIEALDVHSEAQRLFDGIIDAESYAAWLAQTYHYVRWTQPLLARAGRQMKRLGRYPALAELLLQKSSEEHGHEQWLLADLKRLGWTRERVVPVQVTLSMNRAEDCRTRASAALGNSKSA